MDWCVNSSIDMKYYSIYDSRYALREKFDELGSEIAKIYGKIVYRPAL